MKRIVTLAALVLATAAHADNTVTDGTVTLFRGSTNLGTHPNMAACREDVRTRTITASTNYQCRQALTAVPIVVPPPLVPSVTLTATPGTVQPGHASTLNWSSANVSTCTAGGSWSGAKATSGSESTGALTATSSYTLACTGTSGSANAQTTVTVATAGSMTGLDFSANGDWSDQRFIFTGSNLLPMQPATYIFSVNVRQQGGYYTTFFHSQNNGSFSGGRDYYGAHPYPINPPNGSTHRWEISANGNDYTTDANGNSTTVQYNRWYTQAVVVAPSGSNSKVDFYWDLPDTSKRITVTVPGFQPSGSQALSFGAAPWAIPSERLNGVLRGIRLYSASLSITDVLAEADAPLSTAAGSAAIWYMNMNPTPSDVSDKSGRGHHPGWASSARPGLWQQ